MYFVKKTPAEKRTDLQKKLKTGSVFLTKQSQK